MDTVKNPIIPAPRVSSEARKSLWFVVVFVGLLAAWAGSQLAEAEMKWVVYLLGAVVLGVAFSLVQNKRGFLFGAFLMAMQADVSYRILYDHAGSGGIAFPLSFLAGVALAVYEFSVGRLRTERLRFSGRALNPIVLLVLATCVSTLFSREQFVGFTEIVSLAQYLFFYWLAVNVIRTREDLRFAIGGLLITLLIQSVVYLIQSSLGITFTLTGDVRNAGQLPRPGGTVSNNPNGFASYIIVPLMISVACYVRGTFLRPSFTAVLSALGTVAIIITLTRAAWGASVLGFATILALSIRRGGISPHRAFLLIGFAVGAAVVASPMILARFASAPLESSYNERWNLMMMAVEVIQAHPFVGVGPGAYAHVFKDYIGDGFEGWVYSVHNVYLLRAAELGIVGAIAWVWLLVAGLRTALRATTSSSPEIVAFAMGIAGTIVGLAFEMYWDIWGGFVYNSIFWFALGLAEVLRRLDSQTDTPGTGVPIPEVPRATPVWAH